MSIFPVSARGIIVFRERRLSVYCPQSRNKFYAVIWTPYVESLVFERIETEILPRTGYYSVNGIRRIVPHKELNIVRNIYDDGSVRVDNILCNKSEKTVREKMQR
ncbi:hypothetical protein [Coprobacter sp.]|uniref:hypothetical protein n=1 Tax=Coprobacter sp. TaxID=1941478 RepID=UPI003AB29517